MLIDLLLYNDFLCRHQQLTKLLNRYINEPSDHKPTESNSEYFSNYSFSDQMRTDGHDMVGALFIFFIQFSITGPCFSQPWVELPSCW